MQPCFFIPVNFQIFMHKHSCYVIFNQYRRAYIHLQVHWYWYLRLNLSPNICWMVPERMLMHNSWWCMWICSFMLLLVLHYTCLYVWISQVLCLEQVSHDNKKHNFKSFPSTNFIGSTCTQCCVLINEARLEQLINLTTIQQK